MKFRHEPALIVAAVEAAIGLAVAFGVPVSAEQVAAIMAVVLAVGAFAVRARVTPIAGLPFGNPKDGGDMLQSKAPRTAGNDTYSLEDD